MSYVISTYTLLVEAYDASGEELFYEDYDIGHTLCTTEGDEIESTISYDEPDLSHLAPCEMRWAVVGTSTDEIELENPSLADFVVGSAVTTHKAGIQFDMEPNEEGCAFYLPLGGFNSTLLDETRPSYYYKAEEFQLGN